MMPNLLSLLNEPSLYLANLSFELFDLAEYAQKSFPVNLNNLATSSLLSHDAHQKNGVSKSLKVT